jgi:hypothetical protein
MKPLRLKAGCLSDLLPLGSSRFLEASRQAQQPPDHERSEGEGSQHQRGLPVEGAAVVLGLFGRDEGAADHRADAFKSPAPESRPQEPARPAEAEQQRSEAGRGAREREHGPPVWRGQQQKPPGGGLRRPRWGVGPAALEGVKR